MKPVPHGLVQILTYESKSIGATRQAWVYTPPDYTRTTTRYPVLYLLHGGGDLDPGWTMTGRAQIIMDNLIAEKKAVPMIVVMPLARGGGSLGLGPAGMSPGIAAAGNLAPPARGAAPPAGEAQLHRAAAAARSTAYAGRDGPAPLQAFAKDFVGDLLPAVEQHVPRLVSRRGPRDRRAVGGRRRDDQHRVQPARPVPLRDRPQRRAADRTSRPPIRSSSATAPRRRNR